MSFAASAENTMKFLEVQENDNNNNKCGNDNKSECEIKDRIFFKNQSNDSDDDDMVIIVLEEEIQNNNEVEKTESSESEKEDGNNGNSDDNSDNVSNHGNDADNGIDANIRSNVDTQDQEQQQEKNITPKQKYIGIEVYTHLQQILESQKMYPLLPCNMISSFARVMEYVEYFDIPSDERKKLVVDLVKILAYSNNDYGSRDCFEYFVEQNMIDDIIKTIIDGTKNRYDINRFPHTNRKIVLSCVSLSNKIKIAKPSARIEALFEEFKLNLCGLKRFLKIKEKKESKET
jgi:hypothetical protein